MGDLTQNFSRWEFACKGESCCGHSSPISLYLVDSLQLLRNIARAEIEMGGGNPELLKFVVQSGFRCLTHNRTLRKADGSPASDDTSQHVLGLAADVVIPKEFTGEYLAGLADEVPAFGNGGVGVYPGMGFIHFDVRGRRVRWFES
jgi:uncharacterized protein YcbK (DUF882 family)